MVRDNLAYDFSRFDDSTVKQTPKERKKKAEIKVVESSPAKKSSTIMILASAAVFVAITCAMIYNQVVLTELGDKSNILKNAINVAQSEVVRSATELDAKMSLKNIEEYATTRLNYIKLDQSRVEYVSLSDNNKIEMKKDNSAGIFGGVKNFINGIVEYFK